MHLYYCSAAVPEINYTYLPDRPPNFFLNLCPSPSHFTTDGQPVSQSAMMSSPLWGT